jgi:hypothetical protein
VCVCVLLDLFRHQVAVLSAMICACFKKFM